MTRTTGTLKLRPWTPSVAQIHASWIEPLTAAHPGNWYRVVGFPSWMEDDPRRRHRLETGDEVACTANSGGFVLLERNDGLRVSLRQADARFIQAELVSPGGSH